MGRRSEVDLVAGSNYIIWLCLGSVGVFTLLVGVLIESVVGLLILMVARLSTT